MTVINVAGLLHETVGAIREIALRDHYVTLGEDLELAGPLNGTLHLQRTNRGILLHGPVTTSLRRTCSRCLEPYVEDVTVTLDEEYLPSVDPESGAAMTPPAADEAALRIDEHHEIDLAPVLHDELLLSEPMHPLCRPDCPGLCPGCGRRMDVGSCDCAASEPDPRMAVLAHLLDREPD
jgi:uncharacterized protein